MARNPGLNTAYGEGMQAELDALGRTSKNVWYVNSAAGNASNSNSGSSREKPKATIDGAINAASAGDTIRVAEGHSESITAAAGIDADVAGIHIIGEGHGERRPIVTFTTATTADLDLDAANIRISNIVFKNDIDSQVAMIDVNAAGAIFEDCDFLEGSSKQALIFMDLDGGANGCDRTVIRRCYFKSIATGADSAIKLTAVQDRVLIEDNIIDGDFADAGIHNPTSAICTNLIIRRNLVRNRQTGDHAIELVSACTGECTDNRLFGDTSGTILDPGSLFCAGNLESAAIDEPGVPTPVTSADVTTNFIGVDDADNAAATTNVAANRDGSLLERTEYLFDLLVDDETTNLIGVNDADNAASTSSVVANRDGSLVERSEFTFDQFLAAPRAVEKSDGSVTSGTDDLFTITGGPIHVLSIVGIVTTVIGAGTTNVKLQLTTTEPAATVDMSAGAVDIDGDAAGTSYSSINTTAVFTPVTAGFVMRGNAFATNETQFLCPIGTIKLNSDASRSGVIKWYLRYVPLSENSRVVAAA